MDYHTKEKYLKALEVTVREVGERVLKFSETVHDIKFDRGHEVSSIDEFARTIALDRLGSNFRLAGVHFDGTYKFELETLRTVQTHHGAEGEESGEPEGAHPSLVLDMDEIDGTTNTKRALAARALARGLNYRPKGGVCIALLESDNASSVLASAIYAFNYDAVFSGIKTEDTFTAYMDGQYLERAKFLEKRGDDQFRIIVADYSNKNQEGIGIDNSVTYMTYVPVKKDFIR